MLPLTPRNSSPRVAYTDVRMQMQNFNKGQLMITMISRVPFRQWTLQKNQGLEGQHLPLLFPTLWAKHQPDCLLHSHLTTFLREEQMNSQFRKLHHQYYIPPTTDAGVGREGGVGQFVVIHVINVRYALNAIRYIFLTFSYYNALRFNRK